MGQEKHYLERQLVSVKLRKLLNVTSLGMPRTKTKAQPCKKKDCKFTHLTLNKMWAVTIRRK